MYLTEISPIHMRGSMGTMSQMGIVVVRQHIISKFHPIFTLHIHPTPLSLIDQHITHHTVVHASHCPTCITRSYIHHTFINNSSRAGYSCKRGDGSDTGPRHRHTLAMAVRINRRPVHIVSSHSPVRAGEPTLSVYEARRRGQGRGCVIIDDYLGMCRHIADL